MTEKEYYTSLEVAGIIGVNVKTVQRWIREGKLKSIKTIGKHVRIPSSELKRINGSSVCHETVKTTKKEEEKNISEMPRDDIIAEFVKSVIKYCEALQISHDDTKVILNNIRKIIFKS